MAKVCRNCKYWIMDNDLEDYLPDDQSGSCDEIDTHLNGIDITINGNVTYEMTTNAIFGCNLYCARVVKEVTDGN